MISHRLRVQTQLQTIVKIPPALWDLLSKLCNSSECLALQKGILHLSSLWGQGIPDSMGTFIISLHASHPLSSQR